MKIQNDNASFAGSIELNAETKVSDQPLISFDWNKQKKGLALTTALDQKCRVIYISGC